MMKLTCKDLSPETTCDFAVEAETADEAAKLMLAHARVAHTADIAAMSDEDTVTMFAAKVHA